MENLKNGVLPPSSLWYPYISPTPGEFPIICWGGFSQTKERKCLYGQGGSQSKFEDFVRKEIQDMTEAGFNAVLQLLDADIYKRKQDLVADSGLKVIIQPNRDYLDNTTELARMLNELVEGCDLSQVTAFLLGDEPKYAELNTWKTSYDRVIEIWKPVKKLMTYINLSVNDEPPTVDTNQTYEDYMIEIRSKFRLPVWCYDHYPLIYKGQEMTVQTNFYKNLELFSKMSKQTGRPFWTFVQCMQLLYEPKTAIPNYDRMHYAAFSALAYGAQGINYWTFQRRKYQDDLPGHPDVDERFGPAPIDIDNNRTFIWTAVKRLNEKIRNYTSVFLGASLVLARHTGDHIWEGDVKYYDPYTDDFGPLMNLTTTNDGVLITRLKNKTANYLVVVNHSPYKSQKIKLMFDSTVAVYHSNLPDKPNQITPGTPDLPQALPREYTLQPGGAEVFLWL